MPLVTVVPEWWFVAPFGAAGLFVLTIKSLKLQLFILFNSFGHFWGHQYRCISKLGNNIDLASSKQVQNRIKKLHIYHYNCI